MKTIWVNADDFGLSRGMNRAIARAYRRGWISSASIMPTGPWYREALSFAKALRIPVRVHVALTAGSHGPRLFPLVRNAALAGPDGFYGQIPVSAHQHDIEAEVMTQVVAVLREIQAIGWDAHRFCLPGDRMSDIHELIGRYCGLKFLDHGKGALNPPHDHREPGGGGVAPRGVLNEATRKAAFAKRRTGPCWIHIESRDKRVTNQAAAAAYDTMKSGQWAAWLREAGCRVGRYS